MKRNLLSLFCGAGGMDRGFHDAGFSTVLALDHCQDAVDTFNMNAPAPVAKVADLAALEPADFLKMIPKDAAPVGLIGGPPCQGFSRGNVCADPQDPRNRLPFRFAELLATANEEYGLHFFVFENVAGLAGPKHAMRFARIRSRLERAGFRIFQAELNAKDFGVPQRRRRLFIVGLNAKLYPKTSFDFPLGAVPARTVSDAIKGLPLPQFFNRLLTAETIPFHPNHWAMMPKSAKFSSDRVSDGRSFKRLKWDEVSPTVAYGNREVHVHPDGGRRLSVLEAMLLQSFPREYQLSGSLSSQITQVSNAVPPPLAAAIARTLMQLLKKAPSAFRPAAAAGPAGAKR